MVAIQWQIRELIGSLKTRCGMLPSNIAREQKITSGPSFFKGAGVGIIIDGIDVMAELGHF